MEITCEEDRILVSFRSSGYAKSEKNTYQEAQEITFRWVREIVALDSCPLEPPIDYVWENASLAPSILLGFSWNCKWVIQVENQWVRSKTQQVWTITVQLSNHDCETRSVLIIKCTTFTV